MEYNGDHIKEIVKIQFITQNNKVLKSSINKLAWWCNGSTAVFGTVSLGSNPGRVTK